MKTFRIFGQCVMAVALTLLMSACSDDEEDNDIVFSASNYVIDYADNGAWVDVYDVNNGDIQLGEFTFTHDADATEWGGVTYYSYKGFCPSRSTDNLDHSNESWVDYQWGAITGGGVSGKGAPYMLACWMSDEIANIGAANAALCITYGNGAFDPEEVYVTNSAYGYYGVKNGTAFNKKFEDGDWFKLHIIGERNGVETGRVDVLLADGQDILNTWKCVDLDALGDAVDAIYFQMSSSDTGQWGMNNPGYFCLDRLKIEL